MRIGAISYSGKATKLLAVLMICVLVFTLVIPPQPAEAVAATTVAVAAGLVLAFVAACGITFTANAANDSASYWEGQINSYLSDSGISSVSDWLDFGSVVFDTVSRRFRFPGAVLSGLLDFLGWFTGKNEIEAGESVDVVNTQYYYNGFPCYYYNSSIYNSDTEIVKIPDGTSFSLGSHSLTVNYCYVGSDGIRYNQSVTVDGSEVSFELYFGLQIYDSGIILLMNSYPDSNGIFSLYLGSYFKYISSGVKYLSFRIEKNYFSNPIRVPADIVNVNYTATASDTLGLPDLDEKEAELGYVPDVEIPLPEEVATDTNIEDINDAANAVLDYVGTAGNTFYVNYEYVYEDTNVDTGTDEGTGEGTITDTETGTLTGSVTLENVAADSLVEVKPETMIDDETLTGLFVTKFPWCIPFDLYFAISAFAADPVVPEFEVDLFEGVSWEGLDLSGTEMTLSFEAFEKVAAVTRWSTLIVFCAGLAMITKRMIWS